MPQCTVHRLAEQALLYSVEPPASLDVQRRIWAMAARAAGLDFQQLVLAILADSVEARG